MQKTNAMRMLDRAKIQYEVFEYDENLTSGELVAEALDEDKEMVFKTLVTESDRDYFVFVVPVAETLDLKKCAKAAKVKSVSMLKQKDLFDLTGQEFFTNIKLQYATSQLLLTNRLILDISNDIGITSLSHFNHLFKQKYGVSPSQYRHGRRF